MRDDVIIYADVTVLDGVIGRDNDNVPNDMRSWNLAKRIHLKMPIFRHSKEYTFPILFSFSHVLV
jgi:hypothetical protein